jgi:hypothetical protein
MSSLPVIPFNFIVIAPPRCGLAWLANFLSYGQESVCFSEAISYSLVGAPYQIPDSTGTRIGNCDTIYSFDPSRIPGGTVKIAVTRREKSLAASAARVGISRDDITSMCSNVTRLIAEASIDLAVKYDDLFSQDPETRKNACKSIWHCALSGIEWDEAHWLRCDRLHINIQTATT